MAEREGRGRLLHHMEREHHRLETFGDLFVGIDDGFEEILPRPFRSDSREFRSHLAVADLALVAAQALRLGLLAENRPPAIGIAAQQRDPPFGEFVIRRERRLILRELAFQFTAVVGQGGIENLSDALEFFLAGATAISIGTANFTDPRIPERIVAELEEYLTRRNLSSVGEIVGRANVALATPAQYEGDEG